MSSKIEYKKGYKYQLQDKYVIDIGFINSLDSLWIYCSVSFLQIFGSRLVIQKGYAWDGPSGPTIDTKTFMRASLVHDALYQLIRMRVLPIGYRKNVDELFREILLEDGMNRFRAWYVYKAVRLKGKKAALPESRRKVLRAP